MCEPQRDGVAYNLSHDQRRPASPVNPQLDLLQAYPFERLCKLFNADQASAHASETGLSEIKLSIGEPQHETPTLINTAFAENLDGLASYPSTLGSQPLRQAIAAWTARRYDVPPPDIAKQVLPVNGSREALFSFAQAVIDRSRANPRVVCPNPFYQIYEGAALLAGGAPTYLHTLAHNNFELNFVALPETTWREVQLIYVCTPGNPTGKVMSLATWQKLFELVLFILTNV